MADDGSDFARSMGIATSGLRAQAGRMRVISENIANADSTAPTASGNPYRRKVPTFSSALDRTLESGGAEKGAQAGGGTGPSFSALLKDAVGSVLEAGKKSDAQTMAMTSGKANVMDVVTAVAETDVAVSTLVSVRDRVIQSYEDIMKMPI